MAAPRPFGVCGSDPAEKNEHRRLLIREGDVDSGCGGQVDPLRIESRMDSGAGKIYQTGFSGVAQNTQQARGFWLSLHGESSHRRVIQQKQGRRGPSTIRTMTAT
jgi:hypothetical protein